MLAPNGYLHAASVLLLADTAAGYACMAHLPEGAKNFTTIELKSNFLGTAREGTMRTECRAEHLGRTTHVWSATVFGPNDRKARPVPLHPADPRGDPIRPPRRGSACSRRGLDGGRAAAPNASSRRLQALLDAVPAPLEPLDVSRARRLPLRRAGAAGARPAGAGSRT